MRLIYQYASIAFSRITVTTCFPSVRALRTTAPIVFGNLPVDEAHRYPIGILTLTPCPLPRLDNLSQHPCHFSLRDFLFRAGQGTDEWSGFGWDGFLCLSLGQDEREIEKRCEILHVCNVSLKWILRHVVFRLYRFPGTRMLRETRSYFGHVSVWYADTSFSMSLRDVSRASVCPHSRT